MNNNQSNIEYCSSCAIARPLLLKVSEDGYIRLTCADLQSVRLSHLISGLDDQAVDANEDGASHSAITGYTEWMNDTSPHITIGWDWEMQFVNNIIRLRRIGEPRSNLMLQDANHHDLGYQKSILSQETFIDGLAWQRIVQEQINARYR